MPTVTGRSPGRVQHLESSSCYYSLFVLFLFFFTSLYLYFLLQTPFFPFPPVRPPLPLTFYLLAQLSDISAPPRIYDFIFIHSSVTKLAKKRGYFEMTRRFRRKMRPTHLALVPPSSSSSSFWSSSSSSTFSRSGQLRGAPLASLVNC